MEKLNWNECVSGIYTITNTVNGKIYVGKSKRLYHRKYQHFTELKKNKHSNSYLQAAVNKHGIDQFVFNVIEYCCEDDLGKREHFWITRYKSDERDYGYNLEKIDENGLSCRSEESINKMIRTIRNKPKQDKKIRSGKNNSKSKTVYQYALGGKYIGEFDSCHIAAEFLGNPNLFTVISKIARSEKGVSGGFQWRYHKYESIDKSTQKEDNLLRLQQNNLLLSKKIVAIHLTTNEEKTFDSISLAAKYYQIAISSIARIVNGERKKSSKLNMTFKYK
jgi:group I intron endonuclease